MNHPSNNFVRPVRPWSLHGANFNPSYLRSCSGCGFVRQYCSGEIALLLDLGTDQSADLDHDGAGWEFVVHRAKQQPGRADHASRCHTECIRQHTRRLRSPIEDLQAVLQQFAAFSADLTK
jgi:hypothetical protein